MPKIELTEQERAALADVAREYVRTQRYPLAPGDELPKPPGSRKRPKTGSSRY
jgi:hypothetical protein